MPFIMGSSMPIKGTNTSSNGHKIKLLNSNQRNCHTSKMVGTTLKTIEERMKFIPRLPRSIILFKAPVSRLK